MKEFTNLQYSSDSKTNLPLASHEIEFCQPAFLTEADRVPAEIDWFSICF